VGELLPFVVGTIERKDATRIKWPLPPPSGLYYGDHHVPLHPLAKLLHNHDSGRSKL
jgi:hypothetical protein